MRKCACGDHIKHISICEPIHELAIRCVYIGLSDFGVLCSQILSELIGIFDWNRLPIAELDRQYLQNGCNHSIQGRNV